MARFDLTDVEWALIRPLLPNKPRGVARVDDRRVLNGIFWVLRTGSPWRDLPGQYGPHTTIYNRFNRWAKAGVWVRIFEELAEKSPGSMQFIDSSIIRAHQHAASGKKGGRRSRHRSLSRRIEHQDQRDGGPAGPASGNQPVSRASLGQISGRRAAGRTSVPGRRGCRSRL